MNSLKSHVIYHKRKRLGILFFAILVFICLALLVWYEPSREIKNVEEERAKVVAFQKEIDSLKLISIEAQKPKIFPFNPTLLTDFNGYRLGMSAEEIDRVLRFRESGKWFNSTQEFQEVSQVSDSLLEVISPYFKWPKWMTEKKMSTSAKSIATKKWKTKEEKKALNKVSFEELLLVDGVDEVSATKVIAYRKKIGGFQVDFQLHSVYGVSKEIKRLILNEFTVKEKPIVRKIDVNTATASDLATVPLLDFDLAKEIVDYRLLREGIKSLKELKDIEGMTDFKYDIIALYLQVN